jgi:hypothetical protein
MIRKELGLQTLTIVLASCVIFASVVVDIAAGAVGGLGIVERTASVLRPLLALFVALLAGSVASSDERHIGTWSSQVLAPIAHWKQWCVKLGVVVGLAAIVSAALCGTEVMSWRFGYSFVPAFLVPSLAIGVAILGLYVSSFSARSVTSLMVSIGVLMVVLVLAPGATRLGWRVWGNTWNTLRGVIGPGDVSTGLASGLNAATDVASWLMVFLACAYFGMANHRRLDFSPRRVASQAGVLLIVAILSVVVNATFDGFRDTVRSQNARLSRQVR